MNAHTYMHLDKYVLKKYIHIYVHIHVHGSSCHSFHIYVYACIYVSPSIFFAVSPSVCPFVLVALSGRFSLSSLCLSVYLSACLSAFSPAVRLDHPPPSILT